MPEMIRYENPSPAQIRAIEYGLAYFTNRKAAWETFVHGHLVGVAETEVQAIQYYQEALEKNKSTRL